MSQARVYTTKGPVRKDTKCDKCGAEIRKGVDRRRTYAVGFRGVERTRCMKPECTPTRAELESSAVASVYGVIDDIDFENLGSKEDLEQARDDVVDVLNEVADEYESNEMFEINEDLQERAEMLRSAADDLSGHDIEFEDEDEVDCEDCGGTGEVECDHEDEEESHTDACETCEGTGVVDNDASEALAEAQEALQSAIDDLELP